MSLDFRMHAERTPNPNSIKWVLGQVVADRVVTASFSSSRSDVCPEAPGSGLPKAGREATGEDGSGGAGPVAVTREVSPLAAPILGIDGVLGVCLGPNFITVTKAEEAEWNDLAKPIVLAIEQWAASGESAFGPGFEPPAVERDDEITAKIRSILDRDVRPYVEQDGGEIHFASYREGVVEVVLQGACAGCPSSAVTLKMGVEARLKDEIPEVKTVVAI